MSEISKCRVHAKPLLNNHPIPLVPEIPAYRSERGAVAWASRQAEAIRELVSRAGVVLIRGFDIATPEKSLSRTSKPSAP